MHVFRSVFVKNAKNDPRTLSVRHKSEKFWKLGKYRNPMTQHEKWPFSTFKIPKLSHFSIYPLETLYTYTTIQLLVFLLHDMTLCSTLYNMPQKYKKMNVFLMQSFITSVMLNTLHSKASQLSTFRFSFSYNLAQNIIYIIYRPQHHHF